MICMLSKFVPQLNSYSGMQFCQCLSIYIKISKFLFEHQWQKHNIEYISVAKLNYQAPIRILSKSETTLLLIFNVLLPQSLRSIAKAIQHQGFHVNDKPQFQVRQTKTPFHSPFRVVQQLVSMLPIKRHSSETSLALYSKNDTQQSIFSSKKIVMRANF